MTIEVTLRRDSNSSNSEDDGYFTSAVSVQHKVRPKVLCESACAVSPVSVKAEFMDSCQSTTRLRPHLLMLQSVLEVKPIEWHDLSLSLPIFLSHET